MSWFKLDDQGHDHPKVLRAGNEAFGAWCRAGQWSSKHLTEGVIPREVALTIAPLKVWSRLLSVGLLDEHPDGWAIHDFLTYNPTSEQVRSERARKAKNVADHRERRRSAKASVTNPVTDHVTGYTDGNLRPLLPGRNHGPDPDPDPDPEITTTTPPRARTTAERVFCLVGDAMRGVDLQELEQVSGRIGKALDAMAPELLWPDLDAEVSGWISDARLKAAAGRDRGDHWSSERLLLAVEAKAMQRIRFRPKDARNERERDRANGPKSSQRGQSGPEDAEELARSYAEDWARARAEAAQ